LLIPSSSSIHLTFNYSFLPSFTLLSLHPSFSLS
jgi:hypothetical protein